MLVNFSLAGIAALAALASAQTPGNCAQGVQVCGTTCCTGPVTAFSCNSSVCIPNDGTPPPAPPVSTSVTSVTLVTTSPVVVPSQTPVDTTVSVPVVSGSVTTIVSSANVTSWSTTAFPTGNKTTETGPAHTHTTTGTSAAPKPTGAAGLLLPGTGVVGLVVAAALGAL